MYSQWIRDQGSVPVDSAYHAWAVFWFHPYSIFLTDPRSIARGLLHHLTNAQWIRDQYQPPVQISYGLALPAKSHRYKLIPDPSPIVTLCTRDSKQWIRDQFWSNLRIMGRVLCPPQNLSHSFQIYRPG